MGADRSRSSGSPSSRSRKSAEKGGSADPLNPAQVRPRARATHRHRLRLGCDKAVSHDSPEYYDVFGSLSRGLEPIVNRSSPIRTEGRAPSPPQLGSRKQTGRCAWAAPAIAIQWVKARQCGIIPRMRIPGRLRMWPSFRPEPPLRPSRWSRCRRDPGRRTCRSLPGFRAFHSRSGSPHSDTRSPAR